MSSQFCVSELTIAFGKETLCLYKREFLFIMYKCFKLFWSVKMYLLLYSKDLHIGVFKILY